MDGKLSPKGAWSCHVIYLNFTIIHISGTAEARVVKFCMHNYAGYVKSQQKDDKSPLKRRGHSHVTHFKS